MSPNSPGECLLSYGCVHLEESSMSSSTPWAMVRASCLLSRQDTAAMASGDMGSAPMEEGAAALEDSLCPEIDEPVLMREHEAWTISDGDIEGKIKPLLGESIHMMVVPLKAGEPQQRGTWPLPPSLHVLHMYTRLKVGSNKVSVVVRNMSDSPIYLKNGVQITCMVLAMSVPPAELSPEMEAALGAEVQQEPMSVSA